MLEIMNEEDWEVVVGIGDGDVDVVVGSGVGEGVEKVKINDQTLLHSLHVPDASFAFILQYQVPSFKSSGL